MTFLEAYSLFGPDVIEIAKATGFKPPTIDRMINRHLDLAYAERKAKADRRIPYAGFDRRERAKVWS